jgi:hypothetical protein
MQCALRVRRQRPSSQPKVPRRSADAHALTVAVIMRASRFARRGPPHHDVAAPSRVGRERAFRHGRHFTFFIIPASMIE